MQKILVAQTLHRALKTGASFINRAEIALYFAATNDELLKVHIEKQVDLIITALDLPGSSMETVFGIIRKTDQLKYAGIIAVCEPDIFHQERCRRSGANVVLTVPIDQDLLEKKARELLNVAPRTAYRVIQQVALEGTFLNKPFLCRTENISSSGLLIRAERDLAPGDRIFCSFYLPDGTKVAAHAEVVRMVKGDQEAKEKLYGVRYTEIQEQIKASIEAYVKKEREYRLVSGMRHNRLFAP